MSTDLGPAVKALMVLTLASVASLSAACADDGPTTATPGTDPDPSGSVPSTTGPPSEPTAAPPRAPVSEPDDAALAEIERIAGTERDGPFYMVNLLDFADTARYEPGSEWAGSSGREADARYNDVIGPALRDVGAAPVFVADVERSLIPGPVEWDRIAVVRYPSRAALMEMRADPAVTGALVHKTAALDHTFALVTERLALPELPPVDPAVPHPATDDDPAFTMVHVIRYRATAEYPPGDAPADAPITGREALARYSANTAPVAIPLGVRTLAWFEVGGALLGDGTSWHEVRLNAFPSHATFEALTSSPAWANGTHHRAAGIAETYALMTRPLVTALDLSD